MTAQSIRFVYTDSNGDQQIVASTLNQGAEINRVRQNRNFRDTNKVKVWGGSKMFNAFPQQISEFQGPEPEIFMEEKVNGSFETVARVYSKGSGDIKDKESVCVTLYGFQRYVEDQQVSISNTTTDIVDVAEKLANEIDGSYVIEAPAEVDVSGGYPSVDGYSYSGKADRVIQELTRDYNFNLLFTDRTDNNGNNVIRFEPEGFGGAVDTLDSNTDGLVFDNWEKERTENIVNKVEVEAVNSNGNNVTGTASNQDMINKYGVKFERVQLQFVESQSEADLIAEERLKPGKDSNGNDITTPPEGGVVNLPTDTFRQGIENDSVNVVDNELNIDDSFTVSKHKLFYPSGRSELHLDFEDEKLEERAAKDKYLGDRNSELITEQTSSDDLGNIDLDSNNTDTENVSDQYDADSQFGHAHDVGGKTSDTGDVGFQTVQSSTRTNFTMTDDGSDSDFNIENKTVSYDGNLVEIKGFAETDAPNSEVIVELTFKNAGSPFVSLRTKTDNSGRVAISHTSSDGALSGETFQFVLVNESGSSFTVDTQRLQVAGESPHDHTIKSETDRAQSESADITIKVNNSDSDAGDTSQLTVDGQTVETLVNILTSQQESINR